MYHMSSTDLRSWFRRTQSHSQAFGGGGRRCHYVISAWQHITAPVGSICWPLNERQAAHMQAQNISEDTRRGERWMGRSLWLPLTQNLCTLSVAHSSQLIFSGPLFTDHRRHSPPLWSSQASFALYGHFNLACQHILFEYSKYVEIFDF